MARSPERLKSAIGSGLLSFPVTHFTGDGAFAPGPYKEHIDYLVGHRPAALFAAGGTGEFFSLHLAEYESVIAAAVESARGRLPVVAGIGYGTALAIEFAKRAEKAGADGILLLPHYLVQVEQEGLYRHIAAICGAVGIGAIVYHRDNCLFELDTMRRLADACPNLIGFKDGHGNVEQLICLRDTLGDRLVYVGGMPTAEVFAAANRAIGVSTYSSAIFNFAPEYAQRFFAAIHSGRPRFRQRSDAELLHPLSCAAEPTSRLRGQHRQGGPARRGPARRSGSRASARSHPGSRGGAGRTGRAGQADNGVGGTAGDAD